MTVADQEKWDKRHAGLHEGDKPSAFLNIIFERYGSMLTSGRALDLASGRGRNSLFLAERGWAVEAMDVSEVALAEIRKRAEEKGLSVTLTQADLDHAELAQSEYDLIINFNFLQRSLIPKMKKALRTNGTIIFETYLIDQQTIGHPRNPAYLLRHNELLELFRDFRVLYYREGKFEEAFRAGIFAQKVRQEQSRYRT